jgi:RpiB/LacA/LacB family sugar-phosphate isomerase
MASPLYILPFDHRGSFKKIIGVQDPLTKKDVQKIKDYKQIIYSAFKKAKLSKEDAGILVDETYGKGILLSAKKKKIITCYTLEKSGQKEFFFDRKDYRNRLSYFKPSYAKVLLRYNPAGNKAMNKRQAKKLAELTKYLKKVNVGFLLEVLEIPTEKQLKKYKTKTNFDHKLRAKLMVKAISELQQAGVDPEIWKLEGLYKKELMQKVADQVTSFNPQARIVVLGRGENEKKAAHWIKEGAKVEAVIGFAVGRTVFKQPLLDYQSKKLNKSQTIDKITHNYLHFVNIFEKEKMKMEKKIYLGSDHAGFKLKEKVKKWLKKENIAYQDLGNKVYNINDDYPDYAEKVGKAVVKNKSFGILICGSSEGICIAANKVKGIRAVSAFNSLTAKLSREHNDANIICLSGGGMKDQVKGMGLSFSKAKEIIKTFLDTSFSGEKRHVRRLNKIKRIER